MNQWFWLQKKNKIKRFIYASSSSVYGVSNKPDVKEDHPLVPLTLYNKYKGECEPILEKYTDENDDEKLKFLEELNEHVMSIEKKYENA